MDPLRTLVAKVRRHQTGLLLDTNVLLLHLMDRTDPDFVFEWKLTRQFAHGHVFLLRAATGAATRLVTTPHVLTQVTDLAEQGIRSPDLRGRFWAHLQAYALTTCERYVDARRVASDPQFSKFGLADLAQALFSKHRTPLVLTEDAGLYGELEQRRLPVANLNHFAFPME